ncbi:MAG: hypothetical protein IT436_06010 [Phycisphaerales bacterium]|nr:hypothetical protein [Phycisphaerales bacterium]
MLTVLTLMSKVVFSPLWLLWQLYNGLWWAFQDEPRPQPAAEPAARAGDPAQARAFEVVDSSAPRPAPAPRPVGALRGGFFGSIGIAISLAYLANVMVLNQWLDPARAASAWMLSSSATLVASLYAVRAAVRRDEAARAARAARGGPIQRLINKTPGRAQVARLADGARNAASSAATAARAGASVAHTGVTAARAGVPKAVSACTTGLRCGVGRLALGLSRLEARLGTPKTAAAGPHAPDRA